MAKAEVRRFLDGYVVAVAGVGEHTWYLAKTFKGKYIYMLDYAHAKRYRDKKTALKHARIITERGE